MSGLFSLSGINLEDLEIIIEKLSKNNFYYRFHMNDFIYIDKIKNVLNKDKRLNQESIYLSQSFPEINKVIEQSIRNN
tara:strand:+ start:316 stop:549 length:234 start_codon:yes stop_codon:yes gene_type:complete